MRKSVAVVIITLACLIGVLTVAIGLQLAYDVATHPSAGVISDAMTLLPVFGVPLVLIVLLAVIGRGLLKGR